MPNFHLPPLTNQLLYPPTHPSSIEAFKFVGVLAVFLFVIMFAIGPGSIPWFLVSELFTVGARGIATSLAVAVNWTANFFVGLLFLPIQVSDITVDEDLFNTNGNLLCFALLRVTSYATERPKRVADGELCAVS